MYARTHADARYIGTHVVNMRIQRPECNQGVVKLTARNVVSVDDTMWARGCNVTDRKEIEVVTKLNARAEGGLRLKCVHACA